MIQQSLGEVVVKQISDAIVNQLSQNVMVWVGWFTTIGVLFVLALGFAVLMIAVALVWRLFRALFWKKKPRIPTHVHDPA